MKYFSRQLEQIICLSCIAHSRKIPMFFGEGIVFFSTTSFVTIVAGEKKENKQQKEALYTPFCSAVPFCLLQLHCSTAATIHCATANIKAVSRAINSLIHVVSLADLDHTLHIFLVISEYPRATFGIPLCSLPEFVKLTR
jgi:hypothetical protein